MPTPASVCVYGFGILLVSMVSAQGFWEREAGKLPHNPSYFGEEDIKPHFEDDAGNVTSIMGQTVYLSCRVKHLRDKMVSWIRQRDLHILTSGVFTYTSDQRFRVLHADSSDAWTLQLKSVQKKDEGLYECQVNTDPKMNRAVALHIRDGDMLDSPYAGTLVKGGKQGMVTKILGPKTQEVKVGNTVSFTCLVLHYSRPLDNINWYHGSSLVTFMSSRGGISMETEKSGSSSTKRLMITRVTTDDAGNYTCVPSSGKTESVLLNVIKGEQTQMMHGRVIKGDWNGQSGAAGAIDTQAVVWMICGPVLAMFLR